jgi:predicted DNA binding protein
MRTLRLRLELDESTIHPIHAFVCRRDDFTRTRLLHWNAGGDDDTTSMIFHVEGESPEAYTAAIEDVESVVSYRVSDRDAGSFYLYVHERQRDTDRRLMAAYSDDSLVVVPPVAYRSDRSMVFTLVGTGEAIQTALSKTPDEVGVEVLHVGDYDAGAVDPLLRVTPRQREAVRVAVDVGYYGATREGSVDQVAERLGCATATAAEHLRKAEATILSWAVDRRV